MQRGDISNEIVPRLVIVFENLLGILPNKRAEAKVSTYLRLKQWKRAVNTYEIHEPLAHRIWDITWRLHYQVEVCTYLGPDFGKALRERLDDEDLPISRVWDTKPHTLARKLAHMPYVAAIYDPDPGHQFTYGSKGRVLTPGTTHLLGRF